MKASARRAPHQPRSHGTSGVYGLQARLAPAAFRRLLERCSCVPPLKARPRGRTGEAPRRAPHDTPPCLRSRHPSHPAYCSRPSLPQAYCAMLPGGPGPLPALAAPAPSPARRLRHGYAPRRIAI
eukprot:361390-Chlamydomonas_euryale.AAC.3